MPFNHIIATCRFDSLGPETSKVQRRSIPDSGILVVGGASWGDESYMFSYCFCREMRSPGGSCFPLCNLLKNSVTSGVILKVNMRVY